MASISFLYGWSFHPEWLEFTSWMAGVSFLKGWSYLSTTQFWWSCWFSWEHLCHTGRVCITKQSKTVATFLACFFFLGLAWMDFQMVLWLQCASTNKKNNNNLIIFTSEKDKRRTVQRVTHPTEMFSTSLGKTSHNRAKLPEGFFLSISVKFINFWKVGKGLSWLNFFFISGFSCFLNIFF